MQVNNIYIILYVLTFTLQFYDNLSHFLFLLFLKIQHNSSIDRLEQDTSTLKIRCQTLQTADQLMKVEVEVLENKIDEL